MQFSIIIPTRNRPERLERCLRAIVGLSFPKDRFEVLVVDDGSHASLEPTVSRYARALQVRLVRQEQRGPAKARNVGLQVARGEYIVFTDDDCRPHPDWLAAYDRAVEQDPAAAFGGPVVDDGQNGIYAAASQALVTYLYEYARTHPSRLRFYCTNNVLFPKAPLMELGGFDESFPLAAAEDRDLCDRWVRRYALRFADDAIVYHDQQLSARSFWNQQFRYGRGAYQFSVRLRDRGDQGLHVEPALFYARMLASPIQREGLIRGLPMAALLALSQVANAAGYLRERAS